MKYASLLFPVVLSCLSALLTAAEITRLAPQTWDEFAPAGKEVDCIYGDYVLRNDRIVAVIADPLPTRSANMTVRDVGGAIIDLTRRGKQSDQLSAYYPEARRYPLVFREAGVRDGEKVSEPPMEQPATERRGRLPDGRRGADQEHAGRGGHLHAQRRLGPRAHRDAICEPRRGDARSRPGGLAAGRQGL